MKYNDVPAWDYGKLFQAFSPEVQVKCYKVSKASELDALMSDGAFQNQTLPQVRGFTCKTFQAGYRILTSL